MTREYQLTILISPSLIEEEASEVQKTIASFISEKEGEVTKSPAPVKRILGYEIKKNLQAYVADLEFFLKPELINELEKKIKEEGNIIRHMLLAKEPEPRIKEKRKPELKPDIEKQEEPRASSKKVTLSDIDKKIDEILSE